MRDRRICKPNTKWAQSLILETKVTGKVQVCGHIQTGRKTSHTYIHTDRKTDVRTYNQTNAHTYIATYIHIYRQTDLKPIHLSG